MRSFLFGLMCCLIITALPAFAERRWVTYAADNIVVVVREGQTDLAQTATGMVREALPPIKGFLGIKSIGSFPIYVYDRNTEFMHDTSGTAPDPYLRGVSYHPSGAIRVDASGGLSMHVLAHELTHSVLDQLLGFRQGALPLWCNEGLAEMLSDPNNIRDPSWMASHIPREGTMSIDELAGSFAPDKARNDAYVQSASMVAWLELRYHGAMRSILYRLRLGEDFDKSLHAETGLTPDTWLSKWRGEVPAYEYWLPLLSSPVVYAPLAIVIMIAALVRILKRKREEEEEPAADEEADSADSSDDPVEYGPHEEE